MNDTCCGTCRLWEPTRSPDTGRPLPSMPGMCKWQPPEWPTMADSYSRVQWGVRPSPDWPTKRGMRASMGADCKTWAPKKASKVVDRQVSLIAPGGD